MSLLRALQVVLDKYADSRTPGREPAACEMIRFFVNTRSCCGWMEAGMGSGVAEAICGRSDAGACDEQEVPFRELVEKTTSRSPLLQVGCLALETQGRRRLAGAPGSGVERV